MIKKNGGGKAFPQLVVDFLAGKFAGGFLEFRAEDLVGFVAPGEAHHTHGGGQGALAGEIVRELAPSLRCVRSPVAPKMTTVPGLGHGSAGKALLQGIYIFAI